MNDDIVRELNVYVTDCEELLLLQFPMRSILAEPIYLQDIVYKENNKKLHVDVPYLEFNKPSNQTYVSCLVGQQVSLGAGIIVENELHITPIQNVLQMRPSFKNVAVREILESSDEENEPDSKTGADGSEEMHQVLIKRKETERALTARLQSYSHHQSQEDSESWLPLEFYEIGSEQSEQKFSEMNYKS
eukprot:gene7527-10253_t